MKGLYETDICTVKDFSHAMGDFGNFRAMRVSVYEGINRVNVESRQTTKDKVAAICITHRQWHRHDNVNPDNACRCDYQRADRLKIERGA